MKCRERQIVDRQRERERQSERDRERERKSDISVLEIEKSLRRFYFPYFKGLFSDLEYNSLVLFKL